MLTPASAGRARHALAGQGLARQDMAGEPWLVTAGYDAGRRGGDGLGVNGAAAEARRAGPRPDMAPHGAAGPARDRGPRKRVPRRGTAGLAG